ncbi:ATP synthase I chain [Methylophaga frappieri]|jgi:ATP synthase protein I|uniref:ATP synthase I chain n=1 Tax=Methylophaga frappieri (strain ATCC BAA-2434 / DSM 25690 / JAM7) TaxID=754477 RepID=I1YJG7_METFJ|nr:ATP synthase subunit I [Methylophaga frappieri]AFJ03060.1 ATP synthase I chain [Methylophaga frappieri]
MQETLVRVRPLNTVLKWQCLVLGLFTVILFFWQGLPAALSGLYGATIAVFNTLLMKWHLYRAASVARADAGKNLSKAYRCVMERWFFTIVLFAFGFSVLALSPLPLLVGFVVTQLMLFLGYTKQA